ncbi:MAG: hypothetical protein K9N47_27295 [Prosthecobacter sp.]|uniref:hypothetical protein n=1 Tax=Prosthecobacter sp. TaxID=1965333 RepID=UPI00262BCDBD|nr:hypothetical protein [Prosthecobacter sp.]MCF7789859.1 hypothetical protein [Prosthecobacter sp.]
MTFLKILLLLGAIGGAFYGIDCYQKIDQAKTELQELKPELSQTQDALSFNKDAWEKYEALKSKADQAAAQTAALKQQKESGENKLKAALQEFTALATAMKAAVDKARSNDATLAFPEIKLADGRVLKDAKVRKIDETQVSLMHSEGIGSVPVAQLPPSLLEQLDLGPTSLTAAIDITAAVLIAKTQQLDALSLKCPIPLVEKPYKVELNVVTEAKSFQGKAADEMEVNVSKIRYAKGTTISLDGAVSGTLKSVAALEGITNPQQKVQDTKVSTFPAKRASFSANRFGGELLSESLFVLNGEELWMIQVIFSSKSKAGRPIAENILASVKIAPAP